MRIYRSQLCQRVIGCSMQVHRRLGPGLLESVYEECVDQEFRAAGLHFARQVPVPVHYKGAILGCAYRVDFVVEGSLILELKAVERCLPIHEAQVLTYLKLMKVRQALLINFNVKLLKHGIKSFLL